ARMASGRTSRLARLDPMRTLRDLGLGLSVIRQVVDRAISVPEVAAAHADAVQVQIRLRPLWPSSFTWEIRQ
ncbi:hypothetical protein ABT124_50295, partial [Streptomyces sp. NPDC001982]